MVVGHRVIVPRRGHVTIETTPVAPPVGSELLIQTLYSAISPGTELAYIHGLPNTSGRYPYFPGYSTCARVIDRGPDVPSAAPQVGDVVACNAGHSSHHLVHFHACHALPHDLSHEEASAFRLASIALQGIRKARIEIGYDVAVVGLGPIGNLAGQLARAAGATHVAGFDPIPGRCALAHRCGFDVAGSSTTDSPLQELYHIVIEASGKPEAIVPALGLARDRGIVVLLGSSRGETSNVNFYRDIHKKGLHIVGAHDAIRALGDDYKEFCSHHTDELAVLKLMTKQRLMVGPLISHVIDARRIEVAYDLLTTSNSNAMIVVLRWDGEQRAINNHE